MTIHSFKVGQTVVFTPGKTSSPSFSPDFKITRLLPAEGGQNQYRIKGTTETFERMAKENELYRT